jgi:hemoglobin-like flavoprotein
MNTEDIRLVQNSFALIAPISEKAASLFYGRLFELDPGLRALFHTDLRTQGQKLMATLAFTVCGLDEPETLLPAVRELGQRHAGYGVRPESYATVGTALLWTLEQGLGANFTPQVRAAWTAAYALLSGLMLEGVAPQRSHADSIS